MNETEGEGDKRLRKFAALVTGVPAEPLPEPFTGDAWHEWKKRNWQQIPPVLGELLSKIGSVL